jgi:hypothetical protein
LGRDVADISITQLEGRDDSWKTHDLLVDSHPIDVKNARESFSDRSRYSEYLVPQFKEVRSIRRDVAIAAVFSRYLTADQIAEGATPHCTILGVVTKRDLDELGAWLNDRFEGLLEVSYLGGGGPLPGWCFEYEGNHYPTRDTATAEAGAVVKDLSTHPRLMPHLRWSRPLTVFSDDEETVSRTLSATCASADVARAHYETWRFISDLRRTVGLSRRSLFAGAIALTLAQSRSEHAVWSPALLTEWLFLDQSRSQQTRPLGLQDPLGYVANIVQAMTVLWRTSRRELSRFRTFKMKSPRILIAIDERGLEHTIMAYCGGSIERQDGSFLAKCGSSPLVLGVNQTCTECHRLICNVCGFCEAACLGYAVRRGSRACDAPEYAND